MAAAIPNLGPFISLVGAVCLSTLGLMFPAIIEVVTFWEHSAGKIIVFNIELALNFNFLIKIVFNEKAHSLLRHLLFIVSKTADKLISKNFFSI